MVTGSVYKTDTVEYGKDAVLPEVSEKDGHIGRWDHDDKNITSEIIINAIYAENSVPAPSDPQSPQTGDNSNLWLWVVLLFISAGAVITLTVVDRKKRYTAKH